MILTQLPGITRRTEVDGSHSHNRQLGSPALFDNGERHGLQIVASTPITTSGQIPCPSVPTSLTAQVDGSVAPFSRKGVRFTTEAGDVHAKAL
jgi:hypothetical protein